MSKNNDITIIFIPNYSKPIELKFEVPLFHLSTSNVKNINLKDTKYDFWLFRSIDFIYFVAKSTYDVVKCYCIDDIKVDDEGNIVIKTRKYSILEKELEYPVVYLQDECNPVEE